MSSLLEDNKHYETFTNVHTRPFIQISYVPHSVVEKILIDVTPIT